MQNQLKKIRYYLENTNLVPINITFEGQVLKIDCSETPNEEQLQHLEDALFFTNKLDTCINCARHDHKFVTLVGSEITVYMHNYKIFVELYKKLDEFGMQITDVEISPNEILFTYSASGRSVLNYAELDELQNIVDPLISAHDSIRVMGMSGKYDMRVRI